VADETPRPNGTRWPRQGLPTWITVVSVTVALVAVSGLLYLLYTRTEGPGEVLRSFAHRVDAGDCSGSYALLAEQTRAAVPEDRWCEGLPAVDARIDADFDVKRVQLESDEGVAEVEITTKGRTARWELRRAQRTWRVGGEVDASAPAGS
jgi:hypothetical protein